MDEKRRKELLQEFKNRKPEMGIISFYCIPTEENFVMGSKDTKADINSSHFQLKMGTHCNRLLQQRWNEHGCTNFKIGVQEILPYDKDGMKEDYSKELETLCSCYLANDIKTKGLKSHVKGLK